VGQAGSERDVCLQLARFAEAPDLPPIATGISTLDAALGGGLPRGRILELFGPASSGKTTLAMRIAAHLQDSGGVAVWIDAERAFDPEYAASVGVDIQRLTVVQPNSAEEALEIGARLGASGAVDLLIVDSAAALVPDLELHTTLGSSGSGLQTRVMASGLRRLGLALRRFRTVALFINQTRIVHLPNGPVASSAGGAPLKLHAAVRIALGGGLRFRIVKNRVTTAFSEGDLTPFWRPAFPKMR